MEPKGDLLKQYGEFQVRGTVEKLCGTFRKLLEQSVTETERLYNGRFPENSLQTAIDKSSVLLKKHYWKKLPAQNEQGYVWTSVWRSQTALQER